MGYDSGKKGHLYRMMPTQQLYEPFTVYRCTSPVQHKPLHRHLFFELLYIQQGTGIQFINDARIPYRSGDLYLLTPADSHSFTVQTESRFCSIRFSRVYFRGSHTGIDHSDWFRKLEYIFHALNQHPGEVIRRPADKPFVAVLIEGLIREYENREMYAEHIAQNLVASVLDLIARNIALPQPLGNVGKHDARMHEIVHYIQHHIYEPARLTVPHLADQFGLAPSYFGDYFRHHAGQTLQEAIQQYRIRLVETKLTYTDLTIGQIADALHFSDEKHLYKLFRRYHGISPRAFRQRQQTKVVQELI